MRPRPSPERARARRRAARLAVAAFGLGVLLPLGCDGSRPELPPVGEPATATGAEAPTLSWLRRFAMDRVLDYRVWSGARAGYVALVAKDGHVVYARTTGWADLEAKRPMTIETRFHLASMTKPITAVAAMILVEEGRLSLDDPLDRFLPSFRNAEVVVERDEHGGWTTRPLAEPTRVRDLLSFRSGIGGYAETEDRLDAHWRSPDIEAAGLGSLAERVELVARLPRYEPPGRRWRYGWSADVLARVVEVAAGEPFDRFLQRRIFDPLGMNATGFPDSVPADAPLASMYTQREDGSLVRDPQFDDYYGRGWTPGGGGLVSSAPDYLRFALMLWNGGAWDGVRILEPETVALMTRLRVPDGVLADMGIEGLGWGLGVCVVADPSKTPMPAKAGDFWWSGRFGTHFWVSPETGTVVVLMQQTEPGAHSDLPVAGPILQSIAMY